MRGCPRWCVRVWSGLRIVAAQTEADAARLEKLGARATQVTGNLKFDIAPPQAQLERGAAWKANWGPRPVLLAASTREGEEAPLLRAFADAAPAEVLLVLVPRHPQRFDEVAGLIEAAGLPYQRRSEDGAACGRIRACCSATAWANCLPTTRRATWLLLAAVCSRWVDKT